MLQKLRFVGSVVVLYLATIGLMGYIISSAQLFTEPVYARPTAPPTPVVPAKVAVISGKPVRIVIPDYGIDLPVDEGVYSNDGEWTLSDNHAQFALMSTPANTHAGTTFIYGHGTDEVFGKMGAKRPQPGTRVQLYSQNGYAFSYTFIESHNLTPNDTTVLNTMSDGPPRLTIQTCTGLWSEWRTMFYFAFEKVEKTP